MKKEKTVQENGKNKKFKRILNYSMLFVGLFGVAAASAFFLAPTKKAAIADYDDVDDSGETVDTMTPSQHFMSALTNLKGFRATINSLSASIPNPTEAADAAEKHPEVVTIKSGATIGLMINGWPDVAFSLDASVGLNGVYKDIKASLADTNFYLNALGFKYKTVEATFGQFLLDMKDISGTIGLPVPDFSNLDTTQATSILGKMTSAKTAEGYTYTIPLDSSNNVYLYSDADYNLTGVKATNLSLAGCTINLDVTTDCSATFVTSDFVPANQSEYLDIYNSENLIKKIANLIKEPTFNIGMNVDLTKKVTNADTTVSEYAVTTIAGNASLDITNMAIGAALSVKSPSVKTLTSAVDASTAYTTQTLSANYVQNTDVASGKKDGLVYVGYNNDAMRVKMTVSVLDQLISKMKSQLPALDMAKLKTTFGFIFSSTAMKAITSGNYENLISMYDSVTTANNQIAIKISLDKLLDGNGDTPGAYLLVSLDGTDAASNLAKITLRNIKLSEYYFNADFALNSYSALTAVDADYQTLDHLPDIYTQVYDLTQSKQAGVALNGSVDYGKEVGSTKMKSFTFDGSTEFDIGAKKGTGKITIDSTTANFSHKHNVVIDVRGTDKMLFKYTSSASTGALKGKFTIGTLNDTIGLIKTLAGSTDERYTKFMDPLKESMASTVVGQIMAQDYETLLRTKILTKLSVTSDAIDVGISKDLLSSDTDIALKLVLDPDTHKITSLVLQDFKYSGITVNVTLTLKDYVESQITQLPDESLTEKYMDFSQIEVLLAFGIKTSELAYYHLKASASVTVLGVKAITMDLDFYISVDGATVKVSGDITNIPLILWVNGSNLGLSGSRSCSFYYTPGWVYLKGYDKYSSIFTGLNSKDSIKVKDTVFASNILHYLLNNILQFSSSIQNKISSSTIEATTSPVAYENVLTAYAYDNSTGTTPTWDMTIDLGVMTNNDMLKGLVLTIKGTDSDPSDSKVEGYLTHADISLTMVAGIKIGITMSVNLVDIGTDFSAKFASGSAWANIVSASDSSFDSVVTA